MNFCVSQKISARSARSIVLIGIVLYIHSFTLKMVASPVNVIGIVQYAIIVALKILPAPKRRSQVTCLSRIEAK